MQQNKQQHSARGQEVLPWIRRHVSARVVLPLLVAMGLLAYVASVSIARQSGAELWEIILKTWWLVLLLTFPYLVARLMVMRTLLRQLRIFVPWRQLIVAFAAGEVTKSLPAGIYLQTYLLGRLRHFRQGALVRSTTATTAMLGLESLLAVPIAVFIGVPGAPWISQTVLAVVLVWLIFMAIATVVVRFGATHVRQARSPLLFTIVQLITEFFSAAGELLSLRTLTAVLPTAVYMLVYVIDLYAIILATGTTNVTFVDVISIYAVIVLAVILIPIPTEIGVTEITGLSVLQAYGINRATAAIIILSLRILATGMTILVAGVTLLIMRAELESIAEAAPANEKMLEHGG